MAASFAVVFAATVFAATAYIAQGQTSTPQPREPNADQPSANGNNAPVQTYSLPPEKYERAVAYSRTLHLLYFVSTAYEVAVLVALLALPIAIRYRNWAEAVSRRRFVQALVFIPLIVLTMDLLTLPLDMYSQRLALVYEQSVQSWPSWFADWGKSQAFALVGSALFGYLLYVVIRRSPRRWWLYFWLVALPILLFIFYIAPVAVEPMFSKFEPLAAKHPALVADIERVAAHGGLEIPPERMYEMNASEKYKTVNAYVTGFGATKRVVVWDTTIAKMTTPETLFIFGHEMGHYVLGHIPKMIALGMAGLLAMLFMVYHSMRWAQRRWGERLGVRGLDDWASLPMFLLCLTLYGFLATPIGSTISRHYEHQADIYGLEVVHGIIAEPNQVAATAFQKLGEMSLDEPDPNPFIKVWLYDHPPISERVGFAAQYAPWSKGQAPLFIH